MKKITAVVFYPVETIVLVADEATESEVRSALIWAADGIMESTSISPSVEFIDSKPATYDDEDGYPVYLAD